MCYAGIQFNEFAGVCIGLRAGKVGSGTWPCSSLRTCTKLTWLPICSSTTQQSVPAKRPILGRRAQVFGVQGLGLPQLPILYYTIIYYNTL